MILKALISFSCIILVFSCPDGYIEHDDNNICYKIYTTPASRTDASAQCVSDGARLGVIRNAFANSLIANQTMNRKIQVWIGLQCTASGAASSFCLWDDGSRPSYSNFVGTYPQIDYGKCAYMMGNGRWASGDCTEVEMAFVCTAEIDADSSCGDYELNDLTSMCYRPFAQNNLIPDQEAFCVQDGGHLVSIANQPENVFVSKLFEITMSSARIGLHANASSFSYVWTDGTPFSYSNFVLPDLTKGYCVAMSGEQGDIAKGRWENTPCGLGKNDAFVCKRKQRHIIPPGTSIPYTVVNNFAICPDQNYTDCDKFVSPGDGFGSDTGPNTNCSYYFKARQSGNVAAIQFYHVNQNQYSFIGLYNSKTAPSPFRTLTGTDGTDERIVSTTDEILMVFTDPLGGPNSDTSQIFTGYFFETNSTMSRQGVDRYECPLISNKKSHLWITQR